MIYKEDGKDINRNMDLLDEEEEWSYDDYSYEEDIKDESCKKINYYYSRGNYAILSGCLSSFSKLLASEDYIFSDIEEEFYYFICDMSCSIQHSGCIINSLTCTSFIISNYECFKSKLISISFLENLFLNIYHKSLVVSDDSLYTTLIAFSSLDFMHVSSIFDAKQIYNFTLLPSFQFCEHLFIYLRKFLGHDFFENSSKFLILIFEKSLNVQNIELPHIAYSLEFGIELFDKKGLPESTLEQIAGLLHSNNSNTIMKAYDFISVFATNQIYYVDIDLDLVRRSIEIYDKKIIGSAMKMLANLLNSKEFYERFCQSNFASYIMKKSEGAKFGEKGPYIILFNALLTRVENDLSNAEFDMYQQSLEYIATELNDSYAPFAVKSVGHCLEIFLKNEMQTSLINSVDDIVGIDTIERFANEISDDETCSQYRCLLDKFVVVE